MTYTNRFVRALAALLLSISGLTTAQAQLSQLEFKAERVPVGTVFHYVKSTLDGSHEGQISVYVANAEQIESLKWNPGGDRATLVIAQMEWSRFSVQRFEAYQLSRDAEPQRRATLAVGKNRSQLEVSFKSEPVQIHHWPWHSYDFDFTSLNFTLPHWKSPEGTLEVWRTDYVAGDPPDFRELGAVKLHYEATETRQGRQAQRYSIGGPGLSNTSGHWWRDAESGLLIEYEIPIGDEPGYDNVRLRLRASESMSAEQWEQFKRASVAAK